MQNAQGFFIFEPKKFCENCLLTTHPQVWYTGRPRASPAAEISIISQVADFVKQKVQQIFGGEIPEF